MFSTCCNKQKKKPPLQNCIRRDYYFLRGSLSKTQQCCTKQSRHSKPLTLFLFSFQDWTKRCLSPAVSNLNLTLPSAKDPSTRTIALYVRSCQNSKSHYFNVCVARFSARQTLWHIDVRTRYEAHVVNTSKDARSINCRIHIHTNTEHRTPETDGVGSFIICANLTDKGRGQQENLVPDMVNAPTTRRNQRMHENAQPIKAQWKGTVQRP